MVFSNNKIVPITENEGEGGAAEQPVPAEEPVSVPEEKPPEPTETPTPTPSRPMVRKDPTKTGFKQQKLPCCRPGINPRSMTWAFMLLGLILSTIGCCLYFYTETTYEKKIDYTYCRDDILKQKCSDIVKPEPRAQAKNPNCSCKLTFEIDKQVNGIFFISYELTNFYQNHRHYVRDVDDKQFNGDIQIRDDDNRKYCQNPYQKDGKNDLIWPCGRIANSMFSDKIKLTYSKDKNPLSIGFIETDVPVTKTGIAWAADQKLKYNNPKTKWSKTERDNIRVGGRKLVKPISWKTEQWNDLETTGLDDEDFIVWMRVAALPTFRKLYRFVEHTNEFKDGLPAGKYFVRIQYSFPVISFKGTKSVVIGTGSRFGSRNKALAFGYMGLGGICVFFGIIFLILFVYEKCHFKNLDTKSQA